VEGEVLDLLLGLLSFGDVDGGPLDDGQPAVGALDEVLVLENPDKAAILAPQAQFVVRQALALDEPCQRGFAVLGLYVESQAACRRASSRDA